MLVAVGDKDDPLSLENWLAHTTSGFRSYATGLMNPNTQSTKNGLC